MVPEVGRNTVSRMHLPDQDHDFARLVRRFRLVGKAPTGKRLHPKPDALLPTLK